MWRLFPYSLFNSHINGDSSLGRGTQPLPTLHALTERLMAKKADFSLKKVGIMKEDRPYIVLPMRLLSSVAWQKQSINCRKLLDFLMLKHLQHGGQENGKLVATYNDLEAFGIGRQYIHKAISEAEERGLIFVERGGRKGFVNHYSVFTITFLPTCCVNEFGHKYFQQPTHDWRYYKPEKA
jgi:hypothetical protein